MKKLSRIKIIADIKHGVHGTKEKRENGIHLSGWGGIDHGDISVQIEE